MLALVYASGPYLAGSLGWGERSGPVLYPKSFHATLYTLASEDVRDEKPRESLDGWMYHRPLFYGLPRRLKSAEERASYIEMARRNESPRLEHMIEMNKSAASEQ